MQEAKSRRQKAEGRMQKAEKAGGLILCSLPFAFCLLPFAFCLLLSAGFNVGGDYAHSQAKAGDGREQEKDHWHAGIAHNPE
jgi:hypothetical protein